MKIHQQYIDIREEMELIKEKQQDVALAAGKITNEAGPVSYTHLTLPTKP